MAPIPNPSIEQAARKALAALEKQRDAALAARQQALSLARRLSDADRAGEPYRAVPPAQKGQAKKLHSAAQRTRAARLRETLRPVFAQIRQAQYAHRRWLLPFYQPVLNWLKRLRGLQ